MLDHDILEARQELLAEARVRERFPLLAARADWPPEGRGPIAGLSTGESAEWKTFWREVDKRMWGPELHPQPDGRDDQVQLESRDPVALEEAIRKLTEEVARGAALREATIEDAFPVWEELHAAMVERMRADGHSTDHPLLDWQRMESGMREFNAQLTALRLKEAERRAFSPVPDPDGRPISPHDLEHAEERVMIETQRPAAKVTVAPRPDRMPANERADARAAVERQNAIEVNDREAASYRLAPQEGRLDWLYSQPLGPTPEVAGESRLDWLGEPELERRDVDRERER